MKKRIQNETERAFKGYLEFRSERIKMEEKFDKNIVEVKCFRGEMIDLMETNRAGIIQMNNLANKKMDSMMVREHK
jgi:hypothetical protein